jgi:hypothetical protein
MALWRRVVPLLAVLVTLALPASAGARAVTLSSSGTFRDSVGVDTHIVYFDTAYGQWSRVLSALTTLGIRHLRDGVYGNPAPQWHDWNEAYYRAVEAAAADGIKFDFGLGQPGDQAGNLFQLVAVVAGRLRNAVEAVEDPNEFDNYSGLADWASPLIAYDKALYRLVRATASLRMVPVIGPSFGSPGGPLSVGDQDSFLDTGNIHPYTGGLSPTPVHTDSELARAAITAPGRAVWATEAGFTNALNAAPSGQAPVSEPAGAVYVLRTLLEHFRSGIARTYLYELMDETPDPSDANPEEHFGLLRADFSPKPAAIALENLFAIIGTGTPPGGLRPLALSVTGAGVRQLVLERSDGSYAVVLWRLDSVWDTTQRRAIPVASEPVTLALPGASTAQVADPVLSPRGSALALRGGVARVGVGGDPVVVIVRGSTRAPLRAARNRRARHTR